MAIRLEEPRREEPRRQPGTSGCPTKRSRSISSAPWWRPKTIAFSIMKASTGTASEGDRRTGKATRWRRLDHQPATRQESLPFTFAQLSAQGSGGDHQIHDREDVDKRRILEVYLNVVEWATASSAPRPPRAATTHSRCQPGPAQAARMAACCPIRDATRSSSDRAWRHHAARVQRRMIYSEVP